MVIRCSNDQKQAVKEMLQAEIDEKGVSIYVHDTGGYVHDTGGCIVISDASTSSLIKDINQAWEDIKDMLSKVKEHFSDVQIEGIIAIGDKNFRIPFTYVSFPGDNTVKSEESLGGIPISECWFPYWMNGGYGPDLTGFVSKDEFEEFMEYTADFREENEVSFDSFIHSDLLDTFFETDEEAMDLYPNFEDSKELHYFYESVWKKYQEEENEDLDDEPSPSDGE